MNLLQQIRRRRGIRDALGNIGWLSGDRVFRMFAAVLVSTSVARYLGPGQFGLLNYAMAIFSLFNIISALGLDSLVVRDLAIDENGEPEILGTALWLKAGASVVTTAMATAVAYILEPQNHTVVLIVFLLSFAAVSQALDVIDYFFQSQTRSRYAVVPRTIAFVVCSIARLVAVFFHATLMAFAWIQALEYVMSEFGLLVSYRRARSVRPRWKWNLLRCKSLLMESWPLMLASFMILIYMRSDQVLLGKFASKEAVGNYTAAIRLSEIWYGIPVMVCTSVMPRLLKTRDLNPGRYYARLQYLYQGMVFISVALGGCTQFVGPLVIRLLYGKKYDLAGTILSVHIWTGVFVFVGCVSAFQMVHEKRAVSSLHRAILGAIVNLLLNLWWIPLWGGMGSALATLVAQSVASYFADALDPGTRHIFRMKSRAYLTFWMVPALVARRTAALSER